MKSGADLLCDLLHQAGVDVIFGYPGGAVLPIYDALYDHAIAHVLTRHEQGAIHAAQGYARVSGRPGVVLVTSGPGASNLITGIADAYMDSTPLLVITGQVERAKIGTDAFQEVDTYGLSMPITKHNYQVRNAKDLPQVIADALYVATTGRPGPVLIDIPKDVSASLIDAAKSELPAASPRGYTLPQPPNEQVIANIMSALQAAKRPLIMTGGGVISAGASDLLRLFIRKTGIPAVSTLMGLGAVAAQDDLHLGMVGMHGTFAANKAVSQCDLLLAIGVRFSDRVIGKPGAFAKHATKIQIDIDISEIGKNVPIDLALLADAYQALSGLLEHALPLSLDAWHSDIKEWRMKWATPNLTDQLHPVHVIEMLADGANASDPIVVTDVGQHQIFAARFFPHTSPRHFISSGGLGTMGFGLPAAIGAQLANQNGTVILISGDGSFQMNLRELQTIADYQLPIKIAIMNNGYLGMVRQWQEIFHDRRYAESRITSPDFAKLAQAYGILGLKATSLAEASEVVKTALAHQGPVIMDFAVHEEANVYPMVPAGKSYDDMILQ